MKNLIQIDDKAHTAGLVFGILFFAIILITTVFPFGIGLDTEAYIHSAIFILYPTGLFIGLKWKGFGIIVCLVSMSAYIAINFLNLPENFEFPIQFFAFWTVLFVIQMIPVTLYIISWYNHRKIKVN